MHVPTIFVLAAEAHGIPAGSWQATLAVPLGIVIFIGSVYLLLRANLGTRRGYLVMGTSLFGFMVIYSLFWTFGAPGTPPTTGPQNLPGQAADAYLPVWRPFADTSLIAERPEYAPLVQGYPDTFSAEIPEDFQATAEDGAGEISNFFSGERLRPPLLQATWEPVEILYAEAENGYPVIAVTYQETYQVPADGGEPAGPVGEVNPEGRTVTLFGFFDAGAPLFPSLIVVALSVLLFAAHALLLAADERRERRQLAGGDVVEAPDERVGAGVS